MCKARKYIFSLLLLLLSCHFFAQQKEIDSLKKILSRTDAYGKHFPEDTNRVNDFNNLSWYLKATGNYDSAIHYAGAAKSIALTLGFKRGLYISYNNIGNSYMYEGNYPEALKNYYSCLKIQEQTKNNGKTIASKKSIATSYNNIGNVYYLQGNYPDALKNHLIAQKIRQEIGNKKGIADSYNNIGLVYDGQGNLSKAMIYYKACLKVYKEIGDKHGIATCYSNIGSVYALWANYKEALDCFFASLQLREETDDQQGIAASYVNLASTYEGLKDHKKAANYGAKALSLATELGDLESVKEINEILSEVAFSTGKYKEALERFKVYISTRDSLNNEENTKKTVQTQMQYEFDKKEAITAAENSRRETVAAAESKKQKIVIAAVSTGLFLILILAVIILRSLRVNQKKNRIISLQKEAVEKQRDLVEEKQKEILDSIHYAKRIQVALLPNNKYIEKTLARLMKN